MSLFCASYHSWLPPSLSLRVSCLKFEDGEWVLDKPQFVLAIFLDVTALECQLPPEDSRVPADLDPEAATNRPLARWQIKVSQTISAKHKKINSFVDTALLSGFSLSAFIPL